ncbi:uncharacterized protein LOC144450154 [Glandiceps talaboti]
MTISNYLSVSVGERTHVIFTEEAILEPSTHNSESQSSSSGHSTSSHPGSPTTLTLSSSDCQKIWEIANTTQLQKIRQSFEKSTDDLLKSFQDGSLDSGGKTIIINLLCQMGYVTKETVGIATEHDSREQTVEERQNQLSDHITITQDTIHANVKFTPASPSNQFTDDPETSQSSPAFSGLLISEGLDDSLPQITSVSPSNHYTNDLTASQSSTLFSRPLVPGNLDGSLTQSTPCLPRNHSTEYPAANQSSAVSSKPLVPGNFDGSLTQSTPGLPRNHSTEYPAVNQSSTVSSRPVMPRDLDGSLSQSTPGLPPNRSTEYPAANHSSAVSSVSGNFDDSLSQSTPGLPPNHCTDDPAANQPLTVFSRPEVVNTEVVASVNARNDNFQIVPSNNMDSSINNLTNENTYSIPSHVSTSGTSLRTPNQCSDANNLTSGRTYSNHSQLCTPCTPLTSSNECTDANNLTTMSTYANRENDSQLSTSLLSNECLDANNLTNGSTYSNHSQLSTSGTLLSTPNGCLDANNLTNGRAYSNQSQLSTSGTLISTPNECLDTNNLTNGRAYSNQSQLSTSGTLISTPNECSNTNEVDQLSGNDNLDEPWNMMPIVSEQDRLTYEDYHDFCMDVLICNEIGQFPIPMSTLMTSHVKKERNTDDNTRSQASVCVAEVELLNEPGSSVPQNRMIQIKKEPAEHKQENGQYASEERGTTQCNLGESGASGVTVSQSVFADGLIGIVHDEIERFTEGQQPVTESEYADGLIGIIESEIERFKTESHVDVPENNMEKNTLSTVVSTEDDVHEVMQCNPVLETEHRPPDCNYDNITVENVEQEDGMATITPDFHVTENSHLEENDAAMVVNLREEVGTIETPQLYITNTGTMESTQPKVSSDGTLDSTGMQSQHQGTGHTENSQLCDDGTELAENAHAELQRSVLEGNTHEIDVKFTQDEEDESEDNSESSDDQFIDTGMDTMVGETTEDRSFYSVFMDTSNTQNSNSESDSNDRQVFQCDECGKNFNGKSYLKNHRRVHLRENYQCGFCKKSFKWKWELNVHVRTHTGEKPYRCELCDKAFTQKGKLNIHMRLHTGERPFECQQCKKNFRTKQELECHSRVHTGEKPFQCRHCDKTFSQKGNLTVHMRVHTGEKPYQCRECDKVFKSKRELVFHLTVHSKSSSAQIQYDSCSSP